MPLLKLTRSFPPRATHNCITPTMNGRVDGGHEPSIQPDQNERLDYGEGGRLRQPFALFSVAGVGRSGGGHKTVQCEWERWGRPVDERASESVCPLALPPSIRPSLCPSIVSGMHRLLGGRWRTSSACRPVCFGPHSVARKQLAPHFPLSTEEEDGRFSSSY